MKNSLERLIEIGGPAISSASPTIAPSLRALTTRHISDGLIELLRRKNGFYTFGSALHIFSTDSDGSEIALSDWNAPELWINEYDGMASDALFFAEDIFGGQFCAKAGGIYNFDPETGRAEILAEDIEGWTRVILDDYRVLTGYPIGEAWQRANGTIPTGARLIPKVPFVAGGKFSIENIYALEAVKSMHFRSSIAKQIRNLPDGASIKLRIVE